MALPSFRRSMPSRPYFATGRISASAGRWRQTLAGISALSPADAKAWQDLLGQFGEDAPHIFALLGSPMPSIAAARVVWKAWRAMGTNWLYDTVKLLLASPRDFLDARFEHPKVKAMMAAWGLHLDFSPDVAGGALFPYLESMANQSLGMVIGQGGADTIVKAMVGALKAKGGELILGDGASRIDLANGAASGVTLQSGRKLEAGTIIANVHPKIVFEELTPPDATPASFRRARQELSRRPWRDDDPPRAGRSARLARRKGVARIRLRSCRPRHGNDDPRLCRGVGRSPARRAGAGRRPADGDRSLPRACGQARALDSGPCSAGRDSRRRWRDHRRPWLGRGPRALCGPRAGHSRDLTRRG